MRTEDEVRARLAKAKVELTRAQELWRAASAREREGTLPSARSIDEDPQWLSGVLTICEAEIETLQWVLGIPLTTDDL